MPRCSRRSFPSALVVSCLFATPGCSSSEAEQQQQPMAASAPQSPELPGTALVSDDARPALCSRPGADVVRDVFCSDTTPAVTGLADLQAALHLQLAPPPPDVVTANPEPPTITQRPDYAGVVMLTHSTSLSAALISPINPRAIMITYNTFLAFNRGVQQVELASRDRESHRVNLYLLQFRQACNHAADGCNNGDRYTPSIESNWQQIALQDDEDLKNTPADCRQCHQRGVSEPLLLMRELEGPWTHFFAPDADQTSPYPELLGQDLMHDYLDAKGDEPYAGVTNYTVHRTIGFSLENAVNFDQPLIFDGAAIANERWPWSPDGYASEPQRSATWDAEYEAFRRGERLALPYYAPRATDPDKQAQLTAAYASYRDGSLASSGLPDFADIFPDDAHSLAEIGLRTEPDATPADLLIQACGTCHNDVLDQTISRAHFNIAIGRLPPSELDAAIARLELARSAPGAMPPAGRRQLDEPSRARLIAYLTERKGVSSSDDEFLEHAARAGMAVKQPRKLSD